MGSINGDLQAIFEDERRVVATPEGLVESVAARIRRRRAGRLVEASAGTLAVVGVAAAVPFALAHLDGADLTPGEEPSVTATYVMPENPLGLGCGDPVPASLIDSPGRGEFNVYETAVEINAASGGSAVYYPLPSPSAPPEAQVHAIYETRFSGLVIALDGKVVGWTAPTPMSGSIVLRELGLDRPGGDVTVVIMTNAPIVWCPEAGGQAQIDGVPAPGSYLTYPYVDPNSL